MNDNTEESVMDTSGVEPIEQTKKNMREFKRVMKLKAKQRNPIACELLRKQKEEKERRKRLEAFKEHIRSDKKRMHQAITPQQVMLERQSIRKPEEKDDDYVMVDREEKPVASGSVDRDLLMEALREWNEQKDSSSDSDFEIIEMENDVPVSEGAIDTMMLKDAMKDN